MRYRNGEGRFLSKKQVEAWLERGGKFNESGFAVWGAEQIARIKKESDEWFNAFNAERVKLNHQNTASTRGNQNSVNSDQ